MFVVDAAVLLPHPPHAVARVVGRLPLLPRWCAGLRRVRVPAPGGPTASLHAHGRCEVRPDGTDPTGVYSGVFTGVFTYAVSDVRLTLRARTLPVAAAPSAAAGPHAPDARMPTAGTPAAGTPSACAHTATGDGLTLTWTFVVEPVDARALPPAPAAVHTQLSARVEVQIDPAHPLAAARAALCRTVARRVPADLERLRTLLDHYEASRTPLPRSPAPLPSCSPITASPRTAP